MGPHLEWLYPYQSSCCCWSQENAALKIQTMQGSTSCQRWQLLFTIISGWWFGTFFYLFHILVNNNPNWLRFFKMIKTTNHYLLLIFRIQMTFCCNLQASVAPIGFFSPVHFGFWLGTCYFGRLSAFPLFSQAFEPRFSVGCQVQSYQHRWKLTSIITFSQWMAP